MACGATTGGTLAQTASGVNYEAGSKTWHYNWKPGLPAGGYYFTITNQQTGESAGAFSICLGK